jgi:hypothetical protein
MLDATSKFFASFDTSGLPTAFFVEGLSGDIPAGATSITYEQWQEFQANPSRRKWSGGQVVEYTPPPPVPTEADYGNAVQAMLDAKAQERSYDSIATAVSYRDDPNTSYAAEGNALFDWRSSVWVYTYAQLAAVQAGTRAQPTVADFVTEVGQNCPFEWPVAN